LFLGVALQGEPAELKIDWPSTPTAPSLGSPIASLTSRVRTIDAHVYSECARIWNPIHTDVVAARRAGLPSPILHGTATLARSVGIAAQLAGVPLASIRRVVGSFRAPVALGSSFDVRLLAATPDHLWFDAVNPDGSTALADGLLAVSR
jgi:MaoC like domain